MTSEDALLSLAPPGRGHSPEDPKGPPAPGQLSKGSAWRLAPSTQPTSIPSSHFSPHPVDTGGIPESHGHALSLKHGSLDAAKSKGAGGAAGQEGMGVTEDEMFRWHHLAPACCLLSLDAALRFPMKLLSPGWGHVLDWSRPGREVAGSTLTRL